MRVAILTPNRIQSRVLINKLKKEGFEVEVLFFEKKNVKRIITVSRLKNLIKQTIFFLRAEERIKRIRNSNEKEALKALKNYAQQENLATEKVEKCDFVDDINSSQTIDILRSKNVDVLFIWGVPILKKQIIEAVPLVLNAHSSILPEYRGAKSEFWQFFNKAFSHAGITIHKVDAGVDTGAIGIQLKASASDLKNPEYLKIMNAMRVIQSIPKLLSDINSGQVKWLKQEELPRPKTKTYRMKDVGVKELRTVYLHKS